MAHENAPWTGRLRGMILRESQVLGALESHRDAAPEELRVRYAFPVSLAERRLRVLEAALAERGVRQTRRTTGFLRGLGRVTGRLTSWGGRRRTLSVDIEGIERLRAHYLAQRSAAPPPDIARLLADFLDELEASRCALLEEIRHLP